MANLNRYLVLQGLGLVLVVGIAFYLASLAQDSEVVRQMVSDYGYVGIFIVSLASGFNLVVPIPAVAFMPLFLESGLSFGISVGVMTLGMTSADSIAFLLARAGRKIALGSFKQKEVIKRLESWKDKYKYLPLIFLFFFAAFAPLPNETLLVPMALLGYRFRILMPIVLVANVAFILGYSQVVFGLFDVI